MAISRETKQHITKAMRNNFKVWALGPVTLHTGGNEVAVSRHEEEVVVNELLADLLVHSGQGVVGAGKVAGQLGEGVLQKALNSQPLVLGDAGGQTEAIDGTSNPDTGGVDGHLSVDVALDLLDVHVGGVLGGGRDAMVLLDDGVEHLREVLVVMSFSLSHLSLVTCLATREWADLISGNSPDMMRLFGPLVEVNQAIKA